MDAIRVSESEFQRELRTLTEKALEEPVTVTRDGRDLFVLVSAEEFARLTRGGRRVFQTGELPVEWVEAVRKAKVPDEFSGLDAELK